MFWKFLENVLQKYSRKTAAKTATEEAKEKTNKDLTKFRVASASKFSKGFLYFTKPFTQPFFAWILSQYQIEQITSNDEFW